MLGSAVGLACSSNSCRRSGSAAPPLSTSARFQQSTCGRHDAGKPGGAAAPGPGTRALTPKGVGRPACMQRSCPGRLCPGSLLRPGAVRCVRAACPAPHAARRPSAPTSATLVLAANSGEARHAASRTNWAPGGACSTGPSRLPAAVHRCSAAGVAATSVSPSTPAHASCVAGCGSGPSRRSSAPALSRMWMHLRGGAGSSGRYLHSWALGAREAGGGRCAQAQACKVLQPVRTKWPGAENGGNTRALAPQKHTQKVLTPRARPQQTPLRPRPQWVQLLVANPGPARPSAKGYRQAQAPGERGRSVHGRRRAGRLRWSLPGCQSRSKESETTLGWAPGRARSSLLQGRLSQPGLLPASPPRRCRPSRPIQGSTMLSASSWEPHKGRQGA